MRRNAAAIVFAVFLAGVAARATESPFDPAHYDHELSRIVSGKGPTKAIAGAAVAVMVGDRLVYAGAAGCAEFAIDGLRCVRGMQASTKMRMASISKMALAIGFSTLEKRGQVDLDRDVADYLGWSLRNPAFPDAAITARQLLSHTSSVQDPDEYWLPAPKDFRTLFTGSQAPFDPQRPPGAWFHYSNLNFGILAGVIERVSGQRFDEFMTAEVFRPNGLDIGFNWSGVTPKARRDGATLYRRDGEKWASVIDDRSILDSAAPAFLAAEDIERTRYLETYHPGSNPTLFSPQGGLRASVIDLLSLLKLAKADATILTPVWRYDPASANGDTEDGYFSAYGLGVQEIEGNARFLKGERLIGHPGEAYGLYSGAWILKANMEKGRPEDILFAFAATGADPTPKKGAHPSFNRVEERLVRLALDAARAGAEPHPFDEKADASAIVERTLAAAKSTGRAAIIVLGGNWCHDSRSLAKKFETPPLKQLIDDKFQIAWIDVGHRDRNLDVARRFGRSALIGTPTVLIVSPDGRLLNEQSVNEWIAADSRGLESAFDYFSAFAPTP